MRNIKRFGIALLLLLLFVDLWVITLETSAQTSIETQFMAILNAERVSLGKNILTINSSLSAAAYLHSKDMAENGYFSHTSLDGRNFVQRIVAAGYSNYYSLAENIAYHSGISDSGRVYDMWKNSAGHYANMIGDFNEAGLGVYSQSGYTYYTLDLGRRIVPDPAPPVLEHIGNKSVTVGQLLSFTVSATDVNGDALIYSVFNLPTGASFNLSTHTFSWTPTSNQAGTYPNVHFEVTDGTFFTSENINITVTQLYMNLDVNTDGAVNVLDMILVGQHWGETGVAGWIPEDVKADGLINVLDSILIGQHWTG